MPSKKILVVDDEYGTIDAVTSLLEIRGYKVIAAYSGAQCLEKVQMEKPDLVLLDILMPVMDGWEVLERLEKEGLTENMPVLVVTAKDQPIDKFMGERFGVVGYITKPFDPHKLLRIIRKVLGK